jgi:hypothetical protein
MASRILTCVSCTLYFSFFVTITAIGLTAIVIGLIGLGIYVPTLINYNSYSKSTCYIIDHDYDTCRRQNDISCYSVMWSVEYIVSNYSSERCIFSTITHTYKTSEEALEEVRIYKDNYNYTCYYHNIYMTDVKWDAPSSPTPYLIMMTVGFALTGIYSVIIGVIALYRYRNQ